MTAEASRQQNLRDRFGWWRLRMTEGRGFERQLLWIFGSPRSGSSWLLELLAEHPAVVAVNEPLIGHYLGPFLSDQPSWNTSAIETSNFTARRVADRNPNQFFAQQFREIWRPDLRRLLVDRFLAHALRQKSDVRLRDRVVAIKEPNGSQSADILMDALPGSRLLFLLRDGRDVVDSELAANQKGAWLADVFPGGGAVAAADRIEFVTQSAQKWLIRTEVVQAAYATHPGPKFTLRYEDLLSEPARHMRQLLDWLEIPVDDDRLSAWIDSNAFDRLPPEKRGSDKFHRAATPGLWRENLSQDERLAVERLIGPKLRELGYPE